MSTSDSHTARVDALRGGSTYASGDDRHAGARATRGDLRLVSDRASAILIAGADAGRRAAVMGELMRELPVTTPFEEAIDACTVLERAPSSRSVIVVGDLVDASGRTIVQLLGHRNPRLPVMALGQEEAAPHESRQSAPRSLHSGAC